jgi:L-asparagine oxygenase
LNNYFRRVIESDMRPTLERDGFILQQEFYPQLSTLEVAGRFGHILNMNKLLPPSGVPTVQSLRPREIAEAGQNQYSGHFGLDPFPLHTDLAHWALPPRYLLLRCIVGTEDVFTNLLPCAYVAGVIGTATLCKAVLRVRRHRHRCSGLVRAMSLLHREEIFRWDSLFLVPLNRHARSLKHAMLDPACREAMIRVRLRQPGDTILIDNWRMLHGRSSVPDRSTSRRVERVYLSEVF